ncbi:dephospho-CoA kinase [Methylosoma difficile]
MLKVGLTGGIGCGKSTATQFFAALGTPILDADIIAHQLVATGQPALQQIAQHFGAGILNADGSLNRAHLREKIFSDQSQKAKLEALLHPLVYQRLRSDADALNAPYCIIAIPLLFETGVTDFIDRIAVIDCPEQEQISRIKARDSLSDGLIHAIIASQVSREFRLAHADDIVDNSDNQDKLAEQIKKLHNLYISLSK